MWNQHNKFLDSRKIVFTTFINARSLSVTMSGNDNLYLFVLLVLFMRNTKLQALDNLTALGWLQNISCTTLHPSIYANEYTNIVQEVSLVVAFQYYYLLWKSGMYILHYILTSLLYNCWHCVPSMLEEYFLVWPLTLSCHE